VYIVAWFREAIIIVEDALEVDESPVVEGVTFTLIMNLERDGFPFCCDGDISGAGTVFLSIRTASSVVSRFMRYTKHTRLFLCRWVCRRYYKNYVVIYNVFVDTSN